MPFYESKARISRDPIVGLLQMAKQDTSPENLTAIIGSAVDDAGTLIVPQAVLDTSEELSPRIINYEYAPSTGIPRLAELLSKEILGSETLKRLTNLGVARAELISSGGTNAIATTLLACTSAHDQIITHSPHWAGYDSITLALERKPMLNFDILDAEDKFNFTAFETTIKNLIALDSQTKIIVVLNTPFDNPLGKDFGNDAWNKIGDILSKYNHREILIVLDTAYIDFGPNGKDYSRLNFIPDLFKKINSPLFKLVIAGTVSKSFAMYGARVGVATLLSTDENAVKDWKDIAGGAIRGTFSNATRFSQEVALKVLEDSDRLANVHEFQKSAAMMMNKRKDFFIQSIEKQLPEEFRIIKPDSGFFVSLKLGDHKFRHSTYAEVYYELLLKNHLYAPLIAGQFLRIPVCGLSEDKLAQVAQRLLAVISEMQAVS